MEILSVVTAYAVPVGIRVASKAEEFFRYNIYIYILQCIHYMFMECGIRLSSGNGLAVQSTVRSRVTLLSWSHGRTNVEHKQGYIIAGMMLHIVLGA
jgi:hypothetical protein